MPDARLVWVIVGSTTRRDRLLEACDGDRAQAAAVERLLDSRRA